MSAQFTPGPWSVDGRTLIVAPDERSGEFRTIANVRHNVAVNVPLIKTAPELYEALQAVIARLSVPPIGLTAEELAELSDFVLPILAKARAETPESGQ